MSHGAALSTCAVAEHVLAWLSFVDLPVLAVYNMNAKLCMLKLAAICNSWFQEKHCRRGSFPKASKTRGDRSVCQVYIARTVLKKSTVEWNMSISRQPARFIGFFGLVVWRQILYTNYDTLPLGHGHPFIKRCSISGGVKLNSDNNARTSHRSSSPLTWSITATTPTSKPPPG